MYILEIIIKKLKSIRKKSRYSFEQEEVPENDCQGHVYLPIDSSGKVLACKNCGHVISTSTN